MTPDLSLSQVKITPRHLDRKAVIYILTGCEFCNCL
jgi:hypothetical protein